MLRATVLAFTLGLEPFDDVRELAIRLGSRPMIVTTELPVPATKSLTTRSSSTRIPRLSKLLTTAEFDGKQLVTKASTESPTVSMLSSSVSTTSSLTTTSGS